MGKGVLKRAVALGLALGWLFQVGCGDSRTPFVGIYKSIEPFAGKGHIRLELKEGGEAAWTLEPEGGTVRLNWKVDSGRLFIYTKEGGIIFANPSHGGKQLTVDLSGELHPGGLPGKTVIFKRLEPKE
jgi:hypothetical protein